MSKITFSIIMPCFNSAAYVCDALNSVIGQSYPWWQLIAVNDGSTDNTLNILNTYAAEDSRICVFSKENGGYASAVNAGLDYVQGDYFMFMGSDDRLDNKLLEAIYSHISKNGTLTDCPDCIGFRTQKVINGTASGNDRYTSFETVQEMKHTTLKRYQERYPAHAAIFSIRDTSKCYKTALLGNLRYSGRYGIDADGIFSMLLCRKASSFLSIPFDGYYWTIRNDSVSALKTISLEKQIDRVNNWRLFYSEIHAVIPDEMTAEEKSYIVIPLHTLVEMAISTRNAIRYHHYIKENEKFFISEAKKFSPEQINKSMRITAAAPLVFSFLYLLRSAIKKIRR